MTATPHVLRNGALSQDWTNAALIVATDDWSGVASFQGFRGDDITSATGADPQTLLSDGTITLDVNADQTNPSTFATGGVAEFALADPTIALNGSGTADAPHLVAYLDTTGVADISVSYTLRDLDGSGDNAVQPVALQYRIGGSGAWINLPAAFVADATTGPNLSALSTPVSIELPDTVEDQGLVEVRWITANAAGNDEWVGIDDIIVSGTPANVPAEPGVTVAQSGGSSTVTEGGATDSFTVTLDSQPTANVTITLAGDDDVAPSPTTLRFTAANWDQPQSVTLTAVDDALLEGSHTGSVALSATSADADYNGLAIPSVAVTITDNDFPFLTISTIQGTGAASALVGQTVTVEAVVVGDFQNGDDDPTRNLNGFFLQEELDDQDGNALSSEGIFIFQGTGPTSAVGALKEGDVVRVTGVVGEFGSETQITASSVEIVSAGTQGDANALAVDLDLPADLEAYEGMLVNVFDDVTVSELFNLDRFGEFGVTAGGRPEQFTNEFLPSVAANQAYLADVARRSFLIDDGVGTQNPDPIPYLDPRGGGLGDPLRMGDVVTELTGVMRYAFNEYRIADPDAITIEASAFEREPAPPEVGGTVTVAGFNVLNFFNGDGQGGGFTAPEQRGATNAVEYARQVDKTVTAILGLDAEVVALNEIENDGFGELSAIDDLVDALNAEIGRTVWAFVAPAEPTPETDAITVGMLYRTDRVGIAPGTTAQWHDGANPFQVGPAGTGVDTGRAPLAVTFQELRSGETFTAAANHFKSKSADGDETGANADSGDGQGAFNGQRLLEANSLADFIGSNPTGTADADRLIVGDLNSYLREDPVRALEARGYDLLTEDVLGGDPYSFVFDGFRGTLDHALSSASLTSQVSGVGEWHINADEADALDYNTDFGRPVGLFDGSVPYRASDHDPLLVGLDLGTATLRQLNGTASGNFLTGRQTADRIEGRGGDDVIQGAGGGDALFGGEGDDVIAADLLLRFGDRGGELNSELFGEAGDDTLIGGDNVDFLGGGAGDDVLFGLAGNDILEGNSGDDELSGGLGDDLVEGGAGSDTASYADLLLLGLFTTSPGVDVNLGIATALHASGSSGLRWTDTLIGIEDVVGTGRVDRFIGNAADNRFDGGLDVGLARATGFIGLDETVYTVRGDVYEVEGVRTDYTVGGAADEVVIANEDIGADTLVGIEFVKFADALVRTSDLLLA